MAANTQGRTVDLELKKAFQELQGKMVATTQQLKVADLQVEQLKRQITHAQLVQKEMEQIPENTRTFEGIGRMFILTPIDDINKNLEQKIAASNEKIKTIETSKSYLDRNLKESESNLRELVLSKQKERT